MRNYLLLLLIFGVLVGAGCQNRETVTPTPQPTESVSSVVIDENSVQSSEGYPAPNSVQSAYPEPNSQQVIPNVIVEEWFAEVIPPTSGKTTVTGIVISEYTNEPMVNVPIFLAETFYEGDSAAFVLDGAFSPTALTDSEGRFAFVDIAPGGYVLVIGNPEVTDYEIIANEDQKPRVWTVEVDQIEDLGNIITDLTLLP